MYTKTKNGFNYDCIGFKKSKSTKKVDVNQHPIDDYYESDFSDIFDEPNDSTSDPVLRHHISMLQTMFQHRLKLDTSNIDWDSMTMDDVKDLTNKANMLLVQSSLTDYRKLKR